MWLCFNSLTMDFSSFMAGGGGSLFASVYNDSIYKRSKDILQSYYMGKLQNKNTKELMDYQNDINVKNWQMQNDYDKSAIPRAVASARAAGINPISALGESSAFTASAIPSTSASSSLPSVAGAYSLDPSAFDIGIKQAQKRILDAEAESKERNNMREQSYDDELTSMFNDLFPETDSDGGQIFYYVNKGNFDAKINMTMKQNAVKVSDAQAVESDWNKFYYRHLLDDEEAQKLFIDKFKAECRRIVTESNIADIDLQSSTISKDLLEYQKIRIEHSDISAFLHKKDKTVDDYVEFFCNFLMNNFLSQIIAGAARKGN